MTYAKGVAMPTKPLPLPINPAISGQNAIKATLAQLVEQLIRNQ